MKSHLLRFVQPAALAVLMGLIGASVVRAADAPDPATPNPQRPNRPDRGGPDSANPPGGPGPGGANRGNFQGRGGPGGMGGQGGPNMPGGPGGMALDDKQRELFREASQKDGDELRKLDEKLRAAQKELLRAVIAESYDEKLTREKAEVVAKIQTDITMLRAKAFSAVAPTLKPEQREQLENSRGNILTAGGGGGFGGAGPGGGFNGPGPGGGRPGGPGNIPAGSETLGDENSQRRARGGNNPPPQPRPPQ